jgi:hypothetical protein
VTVKIIFILALAEYKMIKAVVKGLVFVVGSVVGVPYTVAVVFNILYGWPRTEDRFRRALSPKKVYKLNLAVLKKLTDLQYAGLYFRWKYFYWTESSSRLVKVCIGPSAFHISYIIVVQKTRIIFIEDYVMI